MEISLEQIARGLGGKVYRSERRTYVQAAAPGHSAKDNHLRLKSENHPNGFVVKSYAGDDALKIKDYVREKFGLPAFSKSNSKRKPAKPRIVPESAAPAQTTHETPAWAAGLEPDGRLDAAMRGGTSAATPENVPGLKYVEAYPFNDASGKLIYKNCRYLTDNGAGPKTFRPWHPAGDGWIMGLNGIQQLPYCLDEIVNNPHAPIIVCEGEKDANTARRLGYVATSGAKGQWNDLAKYFKGRDVVVVPDFNEAGVDRAEEELKALHGVASRIQ